MILKSILLVIVSFITGYATFCSGEPIENQPEIYRSGFGKTLLWLITLAQIPLIIWIGSAHGFGYGVLAFIVALVVGFTSYSHFQKSMGIGI